MSPFPQSIISEGSVYSCQKTSHLFPRVGATEFTLNHINRCENRHVLDHIFIQRKVMHFKFKAKPSCCFQHSPNQDPTSPRQCHRHTNFSNAKWKTNKQTELVFPGSKHLGDSLWWLLPRPAESNKPWFISPATWAGGRVRSSLLYFKESVGGVKLCLPPSFSDQSWTHRTL